MDRRLEAVGLACGPGLWLMAAQLGELCRVHLRQNLYAVIWLFKESGMKWPSGEGRRVQLRGLAAVGI